MLTRLAQLGEVVSERIIYGIAVLVMLCGLAAWFFEPEREVDFADDYHRAILIQPDYVDFYGTEI